jgi:hypothetical protein
MVRVEAILRGPAAITPIIKKLNPSLFIKGGTMKEEENKSLDTEQIYGHGSQRGSMPGVTVLGGCWQ